MSKSTQPQLPPLPAPYRQEPPVYSMIPAQQRDKWKKKWSRMDGEECEPHHYKHYEWECRKVFEELEARERQLLSALAENESLKAAKPLRMFVWDGRGKYKVCACTTNIAEARALALEEMSLRGDLLGMREYVKQEQPLIYHRPNAELALTKSGETEELNLCLESETAKRQSAESQLAAMKAERDQALEVIREYRLSSISHRLCSTDFGCCSTCIKADKLLSREGK